MDFRKHTELRDIRADRPKAPRDGQQKVKYASSRRRNFPSGSGDVGSQEADNFQGISDQTMVEIMSDVEPVVSPLKAKQKSNQRLTTHKENPEKAPDLGTTDTRSTRKIAQNALLAARQQEVQEVAEILEDTAHKLVERGEKLENLEQKAENLSADASTFKKLTGSLQDKMKKENRKMTKYAIVVGVIFALILIGIITYYLVKNS